MSEHSFARMFGEIRNVLRQGGVLVKPSAYIIEPDCGVEGHAGETEAWTVIENNGL